MSKMELKPLKEIRIERGCSVRTCRGCDNLKQCDSWCGEKFCGAYNDDRGDWRHDGENDMTFCPICWAIEKAQSNLLSDRAKEQVR